MAQSCRWHICHLATWLLQSFPTPLNSLMQTLHHINYGERGGWYTLLQDVLVTHNPQSHTIQTTVYRKPTDISTIDLTTPLSPKIIQILLHQSKRPYAWIQTQKDEVSHLTSNRMYSYSSHFICKALRPRLTGNNWNHEQLSSFLMLRELIAKRSREYVLK